MNNDIDISLCLAWKNALSNAFFPQVVKVQPHVKKSTPV